MPPPSIELITGVFRFSLKTVGMLVCDQWYIVNVQWVYVQWVYARAEREKIYYYYYYNYFQ